MQKVFEKPAVLDSDSFQWLGGELERKRSSIAPTSTGAELHQIRLRLWTEVMTNLGFPDDLIKSNEIAFTHGQHGRLVDLLREYHASGRDPHSLERIKMLADTLTTIQQFVLKPKFKVFNGLQLSKVNHMFNHVPTDGHMELRDLVRELRR